MKLLHVNEMPTLPDLRTPQDFFVILDDPILLAGMKYPTQDLNWESLYEFGFKSVVSLAEDIPLYNPAPLAVAHSVRLQDLTGGIIPRNPLMEKKRINNAVQAAIRALDENNGVIIHCVDGTGRTGTVLGCLLVEMDFPKQDVIGYFEFLSQSRGRTGGWPESVWQSRLVLEWGSEVSAEGRLPESGEELPADEAGFDMDSESPPE